MSKIIILNGTSSSGKTSIAKELEKMLDYKHLAFDDYKNDEDDLDTLTTGFLEHIVNEAVDSNLIIDDVIYGEKWNQQYTEILSGFDSTWVAIYCPLEILEEREIQRGDRSKGKARRQFDLVHLDKRYDLVIDTSMKTPQECAQEIYIFHKNSTSISS